MTHALIVEDDVDSAVTLKELIASEGLTVSTAFNLLDARHAISVTERQRYILRVRALAKACAEAYFAAREALGFPLCAR